jgi:low molecular weight protein-tyrosine phosphatase
MRKGIDGGGVFGNITPPRQSSDNGPSAKPPVASFLFVCLGNICRSPLAEGILQHKARLAGLDWEIDSAGTNGYHVGEAPHPLSQKVARMNGIDISRQRARKFTAADFQRFDKIFAMAGDVIDDMQQIAGRQFDPGKADLLLNECWPGSNRDVPDPWSGPESGYHEVFKLIDQACDMIISHYGMAKAGR